MKAAFRKFGGDLGCDIKIKDDEVKRVSLFKPIDTKRTNIVKDALNKPKLKDPFKALETVWNSKFTKSKLFRSCIICESTDEVEMHHVRKIRDLRNKDSKLDFYTRQMAAINRKQVPLCKNHHIGLHNNTLTEAERTKFSAIAKKKSDSEKDRSPDKGASK